MRPKSSESTLEASDIALKYMVFVASDQERLDAFCGLSGLGENDLKSRLSDLDFQGFLLDVLLQNEQELLVFAHENSLRPERILQARAKLPGFSE